MASVLLGCTRDERNEAPADEVQQAWHRKHKMDNECAIEAVPAHRGAQLVDPCSRGEVAFEKKYRNQSIRASTETDSVVIPEAAKAMCVRVVHGSDEAPGKGTGAATLSLGGSVLFGPSSFKPSTPVLEARPVLPDGEHELEIQFPSRARGAELTVSVLVSPSAGIPRDVQNGSAGSLSVFNLEEFPDVFWRGEDGPDAMTLAVDARASAFPGIASHRRKFVLRYSFEIFPAGQCESIRVLEGEVETQGSTEHLSVQWDGRDAAGAKLPDGEYLHRARVELWREPLTALGRPKMLDSVLTKAHTFRLTGLRDPEDCLDEAGSPPPPTPGEDPITRDIELEQALCLGLTHCEAQVLAAANFDRRAAAQLFVAHEIGRAEHLKLVRDRSRKLQYAMTDSDYLEALCHGDDDGDLVPNDRDACLDTPPLTPTLDNGCTDSALPPDRARDPVDILLENMGLMRGPHCKEAPNPQTPSVVLYCRRSQAQNAYNLFVSPVTNQPQGCELWYEVKAQLLRADGTKRYTALAFAAFEGVVIPPPAPGLVEGSLLFRILESEAEARTEWATGEFAATISIRAVNGNGQASSWSAPIFHGGPLDPNALFNSCQDVEFPGL